MTADRPEQTVVSYHGEPSGYAPGRSDTPFWICAGILGGVYVVLIVAMVAAEASYTSLGVLGELLQSENIRFSIKLSLISCSTFHASRMNGPVPTAFLQARTTA